MKGKIRGGRKSINDMVSVDYFKIQTTGFETCWGIRPEIGTGTLKEFHFKSGLAVFLHNYQTIDAQNTYSQGPDLD